MTDRSVKEIRDELDRLLRKQIESLKRQTFGGVGDQEFRQDVERLKRIREVSADLIAAFKRNEG